MPLIRHAGFTGLAALLLGTSASAQITPEDVWNFWRETAAGTGYAITTEAERRDGDRLVLDGVLATTESAGAKVRAPIGQVVLRDRGDGTVEITLAPSFDVEVTVDHPDRDPVAMTMAISQQGYATIVSGTLEQPVLDFSADQVSLLLDAPESGDQPMPVTVRSTLSALTGKASLTRGDLIEMTYTVNAGTLSLALDGTNPENGGQIDMTLDAAGLDAAFDGRLPAQIAPDAQIGDLIAAGLRGKGGYTIGAGTFAFAMTEPENDMRADGTIGGAEFAVALTDTGIDYSARSTDVALRLNGSQIPFPDLDFALSEYGIRLAMPLIKTDEPTDFGLGFRLVDLALPDMVWALLDPTEQLSHGPATLILEATGKARLFEDLIKPPGAADPEQIPGEVHALTVDALQVKAAGADLTGTGDFTFDNSDTETFPGMPRPAGVANLRLEGGNALLDNLTALGLVPQDQIMGIRMMMALFTRPGDGPDTMTSKIEITPDGQILANDQRIQ